MQVKGISAADRQLRPDLSDIAGRHTTANHQFRPASSQKCLQLRDTLRRR